MRYWNFGQTLALILFFILGIGWRLIDVFSGEQGVLSKGWKTTSGSFSMPRSQINSDFIPNWSSVEKT